MSLLLAAVLAQSLQKVDFLYVSDVRLERVSVAGTFNDWNKDANPLKSSPDGKTWRTSVSISAGKHAYKFVLNGETWITDPKAVRNEDDGNGNINSVLLVLPEGYEAPAVKGDGTITLSAVKHEQKLPGLNWDRGQLTLTVEARSGDVKSVAVVYTLGTSVRAVRVPMSLRSEDDFTARYSATVNWDRKVDIHYAFELYDGGRGPLTLDNSGTWYAREVGTANPDSRYVLSSKTYQPVTPPTWVEKSIVYQIFPDRFANGSKANDPEGVVPWDGEPTYANFFGGDLAGVSQHLGYLKEFGANCVYFNPIFEGPSNHRYEATDYKRVDHRLGTNSEFAQLTRDMDREGIKTVLDGVFNHTAVDFFAFGDILKNQEKSKYLSWYTVKQFPVTVSDPPPYEAWFGFKSMPKLNNSNPAVRGYLLSVPDFWDKTAKVAGWRLDVANEIPSDYWRLFRKRVKSHGQDKWIVGEFWGDASPWLKGDQWDSVMNYQFRNAVLGFVAQGKTTPTQYWNALMRTYDAYGPQVSRNLMNLLGSHDTSRILTECGNDGRLARLAAMLQFTWVGAPSVYYGDELGMEGGRDPDNRRPMRWDLKTPSNAFLSLYKSLAALRLGDSNLESGNPELVKALDDKKVLLFLRTNGDSSTLVAVNRGTEPAKLAVPQNEAAKITTFDNLVDSVKTTSKTVGRPNGQLTITVSPLSITVVQKASTKNDTRKKPLRTAIHSQNKSQLRHRT